MRIMEQSKVSEGELGAWKVSKFVVDKEAAQMFNLRNAINGRCWGDIIPGTYTKLTWNGTMVMSDTPMEMNTHLEFFAAARGHVLINGLGLGMIAWNVAEKDVVESVTVVELDVDVIKLVGEHIKHPKITIVQGDAFTYKPELPPDGKFDAVWHDIWNAICSDNHDDMKRLHRRYGRWAKWQGSWSRVLVEDMLKREKEGRWW